MCKHWKTWNVGVRAMREFLGALTDAGLKKGTLVTLCGYTGEAKQLADKHGIEIVNETHVAQLLEATKAASNPVVLAHSPGLTSPSLSCFTGPSLTPHAPCSSG